MEILKAQFELTPEDLIPVIEKTLKMDPLHVFCVGSDLFLEIPPIKSQSDYTLPNGMVISTDTLEKQSRPEYSRIMFFNREIGSIHITQTSSYPTKSMVVILGCVTPEKDKRPNAIDSDAQAAGVLHRLAAGITRTLPSSNIRNESEQVNQTYHLAIGDDDKNFRKEKEIKAVIEWVDRWGKPNENMEEFLRRFHSENDIFFPKDVFKRALREAGKSGIIIKINRRWHLGDRAP